MPKKPPSLKIGEGQPSQQYPEENWHSFREVLRRLHAEGIYIHSEQLAEFFLAHGLPVDLCYVPQRLKEKAIDINNNYRGDMARSEEVDDGSVWDFTWLR